MRTTVVFLTIRSGRTDAHEITCKNLLEDTAGKQHGSVRIILRVLPQNLIIGKWEAESAWLNAENELEWTLNGKTTRSKANATATELELTDDANQTIKYRRK